MNKFETHHYATKNISLAAQKDDAGTGELTQPQRLQIRGYQNFVDAMNKLAIRLKDEEKNVQLIKDSNINMEGLDADTATLEAIYKLLYQATELVMDWQSGGDQVTALEQKWGLPEGALDY